MTNHDRTVTALNILDGMDHAALIAAMRAYVTSKLGDEVEVPEELTC